MALIKENELRELISSNSDLETNTRDLLSELRKLGEGIDDSPSIIPPTSQKKKESGEASSSVFRIKKVCMCSRFVVSNGRYCHMQSYVM